jgi:hypothetical protein
MRSRAVVRKMLHTIESATPSYPRSRAILSGLVLLAALVTTSAVRAQAVPLPAQDTNPANGPHVSSNVKVALPQVANYDNKYEVYGGLSFMNGQAGQDLPKRYNMGGGELMGTYWLGSHLGAAVDYRLEAGTTPLFPNPFYNRVLITQNIVSGGVQWRGPKNRYVAIDYHALAGVTHGVFDNAMRNYAGGSPISATGLGLYPNTNSPFGTVGGSIDFNYKPNLAVRIQPDMIFEHFGTETREFVSFSMGFVYKFKKR